MGTSSVVYSRRPRKARRSWWPSARAVAFGRAAYRPRPFSASSWWAAGNHLFGALGPALGGKLRALSLGACHGGNDRHVLHDRQGRCCAANPLAYVIVLLRSQWGRHDPYVLWRTGQTPSVASMARHVASAVTGGLLSLVRLLLVLTAMRLTQVSYVAAPSQTSVVFAAVLGARVLGEPYGGRRVAASVVVACGLFLLVVAMRA